MKEIICSPKYFKMLNDKYPKRKVIHSVYCDTEKFYVLRKNGVFAVELADLSVWVPYEFPFFRVYKRNLFGVKDSLTKFKVDAAYMLPSNSNSKEYTVTKVDIENKKITIANKGKKQGE